MAEALHHDDKKGKSQSHEIYSKDLQAHFDVFLEGYGATKEEAFREFVGKVDEFALKFDEFRKSLHIDKVLKVDGSGNILKGE